MALRRRCISFAVSTSSSTLPPLHLFTTALVIVANLNGNWIYLPDAAIGIHQKAILCVVGELFSVRSSLIAKVFYNIIIIISFFHLPAVAVCIAPLCTAISLAGIIHKEWNIGSSLLFTVQNKLVCKRIETIRGALLHEIIIIAGCPVIVVCDWGVCAVHFYSSPTSTTTKTTATG